MVMSMSKWASTKIRVAVTIYHPLLNVNWLNKFINYKELFPGITFSGRVKCRIVGIRRIFTNAHIVVFIKCKDKDTLTMLKLTND